MAVKVSAVIGGAVGLAAAGTAAVLTRQHRHRDHPVDAHPDALPELPVSRQRRVVTSDGITLHVEEAGPRDAPLTVVFVHGFCLTLRSFIFQRQAVSKHFGDNVRMVFFDQRCHGRSDRCAFDKCTIGQLGADLHAVIESTVATGDGATREIALVGHSMGGMAVMAFAEQHPEFFQAQSANREVSYRIGSVALLNTAAGDLRGLRLGLPSYLARVSAPAVPFVLRHAAGSVELIERTRSLAREFSRAVTKRLSFGSKSVPPEVLAFAAEMIEATRVDVVAAFFATILAHDGRRGLRNMTEVDVLIIGAERDAMIPHNHCATIAAVLPKAEVVLVDGAGHLLMLERPDSVDEPLLALLDAALARASEAR